MKKSYLYIIIIMILVGTSCLNQTISTKAKKVQSHMPENAIIAHRGSVYWTPELTEAAFRWARNIGADYLELDVHRTKDSVLIVMHDRTLKRTTNVGQKFPGRENDYIETFTFEEIMELDAGSAFNNKNTEQARQSYTGLDVLVFEDVFQIAQGKKIKRSPDGKRIFYKDSYGKYTFNYDPDPADNGNRPGVYVEFKYPESYSGIEQQIYKELARIGWNPLEGEINENEPLYKDGKVNIGNTKGKILLQTFSRIGMQNIKRVFKEEVLCSFLVKSPKSNTPDKLEEIDDIVGFALDVGAQFIGTNLGEGNKGLSSEVSEKIHNAGLKVNAYSFNTKEQMEKYYGNNAKVIPPVDGMITNRADLTLDFYYDRAVRKNKSTQTPNEILKEMGYL